MEKGFYHADCGYWQTTGTPPDSVIGGYPEGTIEVPLKPGTDYEYDGGEWVFVASTITAALVTAERDRRLQAGFTFDGKSYGTTDADMKRITGAATLAGFAMGAGATVGDLRWANAAQDFAWIAADNTLTPMDAQTCFAFGKAAAAHESAHIFAARALKDTDPIPRDFADDGYWP